jgi:tRNA-binding protein
MNLGKKKIGPFTSEVLIMGAEDSNGHIVLLEPDNSIKNGAKAN